MKITETWGALGVLSISVCLLGTFAARPSLAEEDRTVIAFTKPLAQLNTPASRFGIFRDDTQAPEAQFIQEDFAREALPGGREMTFLRLTYLLERPGTYNGWWLKTRSPNAKDKDADWSQFKEGGLVLRVRKGKPCTNVFKVEIKTDGGKHRYDAYIRLGNRHQKQLDDQGYADVVLPFSAVVGSGETLARVSEIVIVLEENRVTESRGSLFIHSLVLTKKVPGI